MICSCFFNVIYFCFNVIFSCRLTILIKHDFGDVLGEFLKLHCSYIESYRI